ncbi:MAG: hypothetical protein J1E64_12500 [Acetatifactor sp.]|nr:hypothetical protein [Acetatifactor sp.]
MKIKGNKIIEGKELQSGQLYRVETCRTIIFDEKETNDVVNINFCLQGNQYGIYGNEYKPPFVDDNGGKKADILILVIDDNDKCFSSWIFDVKKTVGGEDVICHLVEQLIESVKHKSAIATYLEGYKEEQHIGYITRDLQRDRIQETISKKSSYLEKEKANIKCMPLLIGTEARLKLLKEDAKLKTIIAFQNDYIEIGKTAHKIEHYFLIEQADNKFVCNLDVACS